MAKRYSRINWQNKPSVATPISATNLNKMDKGIDDIDNAIEEIYNKRVNNVVTTNPDTFLAGPVGKTLQDQITTLNNNLADFESQLAQKASKTDLATTSVAGLVRLNGTLYSKSSEQAATANVVRKVHQRNKNQIRRNNRKRMFKYDFPIEFNWQDAPINIYTDGLTFQTDFDITQYKNLGGVTWYVDTINGIDTNTGTSEESPFKSVEKAYTMASNNDTILIISPEGSVLHRSYWLNDRKIDKNLNIIARNKVIVFGGNLLTYTKEVGYNHVYTSTRSNVSKVIDINLPEPVEYKEVNSLAECDSTRGSWYQNGSLFHVHCLNDQAPNDKILNILGLTVAMVENDNTNQDVKIYIENIDFYGGTSNLRITNNSTYKFPEIYCYNCSFKFTQSANRNAVAINSAKYAFFVNCVAAYAERDGFNYHGSFGVVTKFIEVNCIGHDNGNNANPSPNTFNGSTAHDGLIGIRVNGTYYANVGGNVTDAGTGTQTINLGCVAYDCRAEMGTGYNADFAIQSSGTTQWIDGCVAFGSEYSISCVGSSTMHVNNTEFDSKGGNGTINITNAL